MNPTDVFECLRPTLELAFWLGFFPARITGYAEQRCLQGSRFGYVISAIFLLISCGSFVCRIFAEYGLTYVAVEISEGGYSFDSVFNIIAVLGVVGLIGLSVCKRSKLMTVIKMLDEVDQALIQLEMQVQFGRRFCYIILRYLAAVGMVCLIIFKSTRASHQKANSPCVYVNLALGFCIPIGTIVMFLSVVEELSYRFRCINQVSQFKEITANYKNDISAEIVSLSQHWWGFSNNFRWTLWREV